MVKWTRVDVMFRDSHVARRTPQIHAVATSNYPAESLASNYEKGRRLPHVGIVTNFSRRYYYRPAAFRQTTRALFVLWFANFAQPVSFWKTRLLSDLTLLWGR